MDKTKKKKEIRNSLKKKTKNQDNPFSALKVGPNRIS